LADDVITTVIDAGLDHRHGERRVRDALRIRHRVLAELAEELALLAAREGERDAEDEDSARDLQRRRGDPEPVEQERARYREERQDHRAGDHRAQRDPEPLRRRERTREPEEHGRNARRIHDDVETDRRDRERLERLRQDLVEQFEDVVDGASA
jgi:hypothetical protein